MDGSEDDGFDWIWKALAVVALVIALSAALVNLGVRLWRANDSA